MSIFWIKLTFYRLQTWTKTRGFREKICDCRPATRAHTHTHTHSLSLSHTQGLFAEEGLRGECVSSVCDTISPDLLSSITALDGRPTLKMTSASTVSFIICVQQHQGPTSLRFRVALKWVPWSSTGSLSSLVSSVLAPEQQLDEVVCLDEINTLQIWTRNRAEGCETNKQ